MRSVMAVMVLAAALGGCASTLQGMYDERAREQCDQEASSRERGACYDRVEQNSRERDW